MDRCSTRISAIDSSDAVSITVEARSDAHYIAELLAQLPRARDRDCAGLVVRSPPAAAQAPCPALRPSEGHGFPVAAAEVLSPALAAPGASPNVGGSCTTLMVRNVPALYTQEMLAQEWAGSGINFIYVPCRKTAANKLKYVFANFQTPQHAAAFKARWHMGIMHSRNSSKKLNISYADVQGLEANLGLVNASCRPARDAGPLLLSGQPGRTCRS